MSETKTSQTQQSTGPQAGAPPQGAPQAGPRLAEGLFPFAGLFEDQLRRWESMQKEYAAIEQKNIEQARSMIDEGAKLMKATLDHSVKLTHEWRKLALETTRQTVGTKA